MPDERLRLLGGRGEAAAMNRDYIDLFLTFAMGPVPGYFDKVKPQAVVEVDGVRYVVERTDFADLNVLGVYKPNTTRETGFDYDPLDDPTNIKAKVSSELLWRRLHFIDATDGLLEFLKNITK